MSLQGLAENIYLLERITKQAESPHENEVPERLRRDKAVGRQLSLDHEQSVASALSFLSSYTDDPNKVSALCIRERSDKRGLFVDIAANTGGLAKLKAGLECISRILMDEASDDRSQDNAKRLFDHVLSFNRFRLLCRLRSKHGSFRARSKHPIIYSLAEATKKLRLLDAVPKGMVEELGRFSEDLMALFTQVEGMRKFEVGTDHIDPLLARILRVSNELITRFELEEILAMIPQCENSFPDNRKTSTVDGFRKLGRYITLGPRVLHFARRFPVFQEIEVRCVEVRPTVEQIQSKGTRTSPKGLVCLYLSRGRQAAQHSDGGIRRLEQRLGANLEAIQEDLWKKSLSKARIHAEIQLVFYYERNPDTKLRPRVICASKNACYLCNTFLDLHGQFYTPRSHGKVYPQWTLPELRALPLSAKRLKELHAVYALFHTQIEQKILACLRRSLLTQTYDNESRILNVRSLTPSVVSRVNDVENGPDTSLGTNAQRETSLDGEVSAESFNTPCADEGCSRNDYAQGSAPLPTNSVALFLPADGRNSRPSSPRAAKSQVRLQHVADPAPVSSDILRPIASPIEPVVNEPQNLVPGRSVSYFIPMSSPPIRIHTTRIHIELSYEEAQSVASAMSVQRRDSKINSASEGVQICAVWLQADEMESTQDHNREVDLAGDWTLKKLDAVLFEPDGLILRNGKDVVRLRAEDGLLSNH